MDEEYKITYFVADELKSGGKYISVKKKIKKINVTEHTLTFWDGAEIAMEDISDIEHEIFDVMETMQ